ncbi:MAG: hypothetical protein KF768_02595 [Phycisphaeraceae bacterium]|nr:hypothetical protein [Phycisphaeraceae bacterium]
MTHAPPPSASGPPSSANPTGAGTGIDREPPETTRVLMGGLIDYAGLFPPAKLPMKSAVEKYDRCLRSDHAWMLGRFIVPVSRLGEFRDATTQLLPRVQGESEPGYEQPWLVSALIDGDLERDFDAIFEFNHRHAQAINGLAMIDAVELRVPAPDASGGGTSPSNFIDTAIESMPEELFAFFEVPSAMLSDCRGVVASLAGADAAAKIRTGGVTTDAFPPADAVASFLIACAAADVPFKATAGLHHAVRAHYPLTYEPNCPKWLMHGFVNIFTSAALVRTHRVASEAVVELLEDTNPHAFVFGRDLLTWKHPRLGSFGLTLEQLAHTRETFALSYGSCSFDEPVSELCAMGVLP